MDEELKACPFWGGPASNSEVSAEEFGDKLYTVWCEECGVGTPASEEQVGKMKKIFISVPMRDRFEDEILREQTRLLGEANEYLKEPVELVETYQAEGKFNALEYLGESIKRMAVADYVMFGKGWDDERGCKIEMACALHYNKKILIEDGNIIQEVL